MGQSNEATWEQQALEKAVMASVTEQRRSRRWGIFFKILIFAYIILMTVAFYTQSSGRAHPSKGKTHVGMIDINGEIGDNKEVDADQVATALRNAYESDDLKAIILRINSPGGSPVQSAYIYDEIKRLKSKKPEIPVYSVIVDIGASGAYYIAAATDKIYANPSSLVGSIGVLLPNFGFVDGMQKLGVEQRTLTAGENKMLLDPFSPKNPQQIAFAQSVINNVHQHFIHAVKTGRGDRLDLSKEKELFSGLFWSGDQAKQLGLIDDFGSVGGVARDVLGTEDILDYTVKPNFFDMIGLQTKLGFGKAFELFGLDSRTISLY